MIVDSAFGKPGFELRTFWTQVTPTFSNDGIRTYNLLDLYIKIFIHKNIDNTIFLSLKISQRKMDNEYFKISNRISAIKLKFLH